MHKSKLAHAFAVLFFFITCGTCMPVVGQTARVEAIRKLCGEVEKRIAEAEQEPESSTTFLTELAVNKNLSPYPAVGVYRSVVRFYYTFGDREKNPYPDRLLKIAVSTERSDRKEYSEFVFDDAGRLVFYSEKKDDVERRLYFTSERLIRFQEGERSLGLRGRSQVEFVAQVLKEKTNLVAMFRRSLDF